MALPARPNANSFLNAKRSQRPPKHAYPIRLQPELHEWLAGFADRRGRSMADVIRSAVWEYREKHDV